MKKLLLLLCLLLTACAPAAAPKSRIEVSQASVRLLSGDMPAAGYMTLKNTSGQNDKLLNVSVDFAASTMLHQTSVDDSNVARMVMVSSIDIPAGQQVELKPGGFHIVFEAISPELKPGDSVLLTLEFENLGTITVEAQVTGQ